MVAVRTKIDQLFVCAFRLFTVVTKASRRSWDCWSAGSLCPQGGAQCQLALGKCQLATVAYHRGADFVDLGRLMWGVKDRQRFFAPTCFFPQEKDSKRERLVGRLRCLASEAYEIMWRRVWLVFVVPLEG